MEDASDNFTLWLDFGASSTYFFFFFSWTISNSETLTALSVIFRKTWKKTHGGLSP